MTDTSPLSAMAKMGWLPWLKERWGRVLVPGDVWRELGKMDDADALAKLEAARMEGWLVVNSVCVQDMPEFAELHPGEIEAICLALKLKADWLIVDDGDARHAARSLGLRIIGVLGMIVWAKKSGRIAKAVDCIEQLRRRTKFRVSTEVLAGIVTDLGEAE
ncbi:MAG: DUF3368 domain-containing protein [Roseimicrobium sp.]